MHDVTKAILSTKWEKMRNTGKTSLMPCTGTRRRRNFVGGQKGGQTMDEDCSEGEEIKAFFRHSLPRVHHEEMQQPQCRREAMWTVRTCQRRNRSRNTPKNP